ncbi:MAG: hypothetical protein K0U98_15220 [Deltaproteobacteria bacterium]|nr:hypothetical protein [Deltaproteobacteria bacterium]
MEFTLLFSKVVGPVLILRALSILLSREHFFKMIDGMEREVTTVSFSFFPIALFMSCTAIAVTHSDRSSFAAFLILLIAWGGMAKGAALILFPHLSVEKGRHLVKPMFLNIVLFVCLAVGGYFTWFGYFGHG